MKNEPMEDRTKELFGILGTPFAESGPNTEISGERLDELFDFAFKNRVALLMLDRAELRGIELTKNGRANLELLRDRRHRTDEVLDKVTRILDSKFKDEWVFFKTVKPFLSTPNDTDWFPFDTKKHQDMCDLLLKNGFEYLENAPLQLTLIDSSGSGIADSDKRGGVWYLDCYRAPGADYFKYLDPSKMRKHFTRTEDSQGGYPILGDIGEFIATCFHNVFPEKTYSLESFYLICEYVKKIKTRGQMGDLVMTVRSNYVERAVSANLSVTIELHKKYFGFVPPELLELIGVFTTGASEGKYISHAEDDLPFNFSARTFWLCLIEKMRDPISFRSMGTQLLHMLNPVFFWGVVTIIWKRSTGGGIYKQM